MPMTPTTVQMIADNLQARAIWYEQPLDYTAGVQAVVREIQRHLVQFEAARTNAPGGTAASG